MMKVYSITIMFIAWVSFSTTPDKLVRLIKSPYSYQKTIDNIKLAIASNNFKIVRQNTSALAHTFYFCNFNVAHNIIAKDKRVGVLVPCRIKIIKSHSNVYVATLNVESLVKQVGINIGTHCRKIKKSIDTILEEAMI
ncbi:hypothetical protein MNBD_GAMMA12-1083 [hydrothermal vent metagenome]|uniref:DUF302 domain-containing protein n=1 Tax=hydrothermal vent metagenome TaxID=652676 RepID=A0A3B0YAG3_9ZZZZ